MPPPETVKDKVRKCIQQIEATFTADRTRLRPGDDGALLSWRIDVPESCPGIVTVSLNSSTVARNGSRRVHPVRSAVYSLVAGGAGFTKTIGSVQIFVDSTGCGQSGIAESDVVPQVQGSVDASISEYNNDPKNTHKVTRRRQTEVELEPSGIVIRLRLRLDINNFADPNVDVDAKLAIGISTDGKVFVFYRSFTVDVDWPWWVSGITQGIMKILEEFADTMVEVRLKERLREDFRKNIQAALGLFGGRVVDLDTAQDRIVATICPPT